ncbi:hypothetical protein [Ochrobactrum sp. BTU1]|uniref:hypothetical protein n=1 Tax=Ochrobactrum sp. BTU1 TaxID=2840456 RepID=UPI001C0566C5|nr:hypothetical protein KMS41_26150 [Ochrobactrum sp. BTU1]
MEYKLNSLPIAPVFSERTRKELKIYYDWYIGSITDRTEILVNEIRKKEKYKSVSFDYAPETLLPLGEWFASVVETRQRTESELQEIVSSLKFPIEVPKEELTNKTFSVALDVGMYLSQVFLKKFDDLNWTQTWGRKDSVDYGQPVLSPFQKRVFNPTRMMVVQAYGVSRGSKNSNSLSELFNTWTQMKLTGEFDKAIRVAP